MALLPCEGTYDGYEDRLYKGKSRLILEDETEEDKEEENDKMWNTPKNALTNHYRTCIMLPCIMEIKKD